MMRTEHNFNLLHYNTFGIDACCDTFVEYDSTDEAAELALRLADGPYLLLGGGSDLLLTGNFHGTVAHSAIRGFEVSEAGGDDVVVRCGSAEVWDDVVSRCVGLGLHGMENLSLIPGEVGASAVQNIGAYGAEVKDLITTVEVVEIGTGRRLTLSNADCRYAYRDSRFKHDWRDQYIVCYVSYRLSRKFNPRLDYGNIRAELAEEGITSPTPQQLRDAIISIRQAKLPDPKVMGNAGSFFVNPIVSREKFLSLQKEWPSMPHYTLSDGREKIPAGWMIEQCGWKGRHLGKAGVHSKQALVLVNLGGATGSDIIELMRRVQADVKERFGISIVPEVNVV